MTEVEVCDLQPLVAVTAEELGASRAGATVPETGVAVLAVGGLVADLDHIVLDAVDVGHEAVVEGLLFHVPDDEVVSLEEAEVGLAAGPELGEVELEGLALQYQLAQELAVEGEGADLGTAAADLDRGVVEALAREAVGDVRAGEPEPGGREVRAPVLVRIAIAGLWVDQVAAAVQDDVSRKEALDALRMPEHLEGSRVANGLGGTEAHVEGNPLVDLEVEHDLTRIAHPLRMLGCLLFGDLHMADEVPLGADAVVCRDPEGGAVSDRDVVPAEETVHLLGALSPGADVDHQVGGTASVTDALAGHAKEGRGSAQGGVDREELDVEGALLAGDRVMGGQ